MAEVKTAGTKIHYVRPQEKGCRTATLLADSFQEHVTFPHRGTFDFGHLAYGDPAGSDTKHTFEVVRRHDPVGAVDTWHLASECPLRAERGRAEQPRAERGRVEQPQAP